MIYPNQSELKISVLIRSMDRPTLSRSFDSIASQTHRPSEIVVVAACGPHHGALPTFWKNLPIRLIVPPNQLDRAAAANVAIDAAAGDWINFLDDDDELLPDHFAKLTSALQTFPQVRLAFSKTIVVKEDGSEAGYFGWLHHRKNLFEKSQFHLMAAIFHRSLIEDGARFDESLPIHEDLDFWIQCAQRTRFEFVDHITNRWHAFVGTSGAGGGNNLNGALVEQIMNRVKSKWASVNQDWLQEWENTLEGRLFLGQQALKTGHPDIALQFLQRALDLAPDNVNALNLGGMANLHLGDLERAKALLIRAASFAPGHSGIRQNLQILERQLHARNNLGQ